MTHNIRSQIKSIYKTGFTGLCSFSFISIMFMIGLLSVGDAVIGNSRGVIRLLLILSVTFFVEISVAPIIIGAYKWIHGLHMGKMRPMKTAFSEFSDLISIYEAQKSVLMYLFFAKTALTPFLLTIIIVSHSTISHTSIFFIIASFSLSFQLLCGIFPLLHILLNAPRIPVTKAVKLSFGCMRKRRGEFFRLMLTYSVLGVISLASFGIMLIFTIPYIFCSAVVYCDTVFEEHQLYKYNLFY